MRTPPLGAVRVSSKGREQLIKLKRLTSIENWNTMLRWALCLSLAEQSEPSGQIYSGGDGIEMTWKIFSGDTSDYLSAALWFRLTAANSGEAQETADSYFRKHLHRGLHYLTARNLPNGIADFIDIINSEQENQTTQS